MAGVLYVVATPIGNLEDITYRAVSTLRDVDVILCEDTRVTGRLLERYEIEGKMQTFTSHTKDKDIAAISEALQNGVTYALVSDAGTPGVSDPAVYLLQHLRKQASDVSVVPIPGVSAVTALWSVAGLSGNSFLFYGFLPQKKGRETAFREILESQVPVIFYESVYRIVKALTEIHQKDPERRIILGRELTKMHESVLDGVAYELLDHFEAHPDQLRGEFTVIVVPK